MAMFENQGKSVVSWEPFTQWCEESGFDDASVKVTMSQYKSELQRNDPINIALLAVAVGDNLAADTAFAHIRNRNSKK